MVRRRRAHYYDTCYFFWMSYYGPKKEAENYKYTIKILSSKDVFVYQVDNFL